MRRKRTELPVCPPTTGTPADAIPTARQRAEELVRAEHDLSQGNSYPPSLEATQRMLHDLRVHQIELEMQNEELRLSQIALDISRDNYLDLYDLAPVGYCTISTAGLIVQANLTLATALGIARGALVGRPFSRFVFNGDVGRYYQQKKRVLEADGEVPAYELRLLKAEGTFFWGQLTITVVTENDGTAMLRTVITDITERKRAERVLRESEMRWQFAVEIHGGGMWDWDADSDELFLSDAAKGLFDLPDQPMRRPIADLLARIVDEDRALVRSQIDELVAGKSSEWRSECRFFGSAATRWVATRGRVMIRSADGRPQSIVSISYDITEKKRRATEAERQRALVAHQGRLVLLGELASALAHEINQPLTAIAGFAAACARRMAESSEALELVRAIEEQAIRAGEITWRMLGFARRQSLGRSRLAIAEVVAAVAQWMRMDSANLDVVIDVSGVGVDLPRVKADRVELEQVLINLVRNGIEAGLPHTPGQRIAIAGFAGAKPGELEIMVSDWGCGLPAGTDFEVFQPFATSKEEGLGLGLTICSSIIEGHGGRLWATENPEGGTIFHFTLPTIEETR